MIVIVIQYVIVVLYVIVKYVIVIYPYDIFIIPPWLEQLHPCNSHVFMAKSHQFPQFQMVKSHEASNFSQLSPSDCIPILEVVKSHEISVYALFRWLNHVKSQEILL